MVRLGQRDEADLMSLRSDERWRLDITFWCSRPASTQQQIAHRSSFLSRCAQEWNDSRKISAAIILGHQNWYRRQCLGLDLAALSCDNRMHQPLMLEIPTNDLSYRLSLIPSHAISRSHTCTAIEVSRCRSSQSSEPSSPGVSQPVGIDWWKDPEQAQLKVSGFKRLSPPYKGE